MIAGATTLAAHRVSVIRRFMRATLPRTSRHFTVRRLAPALIHPADMESMLWIGLAWVVLSVPVALGFCALAISGDAPELAENTESALAPRLAA